MRLVPLPFRPLLRPLLLLSLLGLAPGCAPPGPSPHEVAGRALFTSPQSNPIALTPDGSRVYAAHTTANSVKVIDTTGPTVVATILVGLDPVSVAVSPNGNEVLVANHLSDSVSVISSDPASPRYHQVIQTIQQFTPAGATRFDEPVGVAFASDTKAYVALSSTDQVAVLNRGATQWSVDPTKLRIKAQDPRALAVRDGKLYVAAFESGNQTELSACPDGIGMSGSPPDCTLGVPELAQFVAEPNLPDAVKNIVFDPDVPDRDVFVYDTSDDSFLEHVEHVGTLLYGLAVDSTGQVFVTQTEARNDVNGIEPANLVDLDNRMFLNRIARIDCGGGGSCSFSPGSDIFDLELLPPTNPPDGEQLATPYGIAISDDDSVIVATAAASSRVFTMNPTSGVVRDVADVGAIPRGVALRSNPGTNAPETAYVLNSLDNSVTVVDVSDPDALVVGPTLDLGPDYLPAAVRRGRIAFNDANASSNGTFACASCHPDGNTDQLLWRIGGKCFFGNCSGNDEPRTTMPAPRGIDNTLPLHWDGSLGDPFGGPNGEVGSGGPNESPLDCSDDHGCFVHLVEASLSAVMCDQSDACAGGGELTAQERDDMGTFLAAVWYPPARERRLDDSLSNPLFAPSAVRGFQKFFTDKDGGGDPDTCADSTAGCHALPLGVSTNSSLGAFDAPTLRGLTDRFVQFSNGLTSAQEALDWAAAGIPSLVAPSAFPWDPSIGLEELTTFAAAFGAVFTPAYGVGPADIFQMLEEASTGTSGATGRQVTLSQKTLSGGSAAATQALLDDLEDADARDAVNLRGAAVWLGFQYGISYDADADVYLIGGGGGTLTRSELEAQAASGALLATLTAHLPANFGTASQPLLAPTSTGSGPTGDPDLPVLDPTKPQQLAIQLAGIDVRSDPAILVDGQPVAGSVSCNQGGAFTPYCTTELVTVTLAAFPSPNGVHFLQLQNPKGPFSNELLVCIGDAVDDCGVAP